ncbi:MAG: hypothetical protein ACLQBL_19205 [Polyangiaceae bacterium]
MKIKTKVKAGGVGVGLGDCNPNTKCPPGPINGLGNLGGVYR